jgi:hydrogenase-4 component E
MAAWTDIFVLGLVLSNFRLLASSRLTVMIETMVLQAFALTAILLTLADRPWPLRLIVLSLVTLAVKGALLPWLLRRTMRAADVRREIEPFIGYNVSILAGIAILGLGFLIVQPLKATVVPGSASLLPGALFTTLTGLLIIVSRRKALAQVVGYLAMENGIYAFGAALVVKEPMLVEMGVLLDVFVAVFVMGITIYQINREFDHIDTDRLSELKD